MNKREESKELEHLVNEWKKSNKIEIPISRFQSKYNTITEIRCTICDFCYGVPSLFNPEVSEYRSVRIEIDETTGANICSECMRRSKQMAPNTRDYNPYKYLHTKGRIGEGSYRKRALIENE